MYLLSHAMSLSNVLVNVVGIHLPKESLWDLRDKFYSRGESKSNSWHDFKGTVSKYTKLMLCSLLFIAPMNAQQETSAINEKQKFSKAIEDNSYFIEEAYNQETGVVQHISNGLYFTKPQTDFNYSFTQEWPLGGQTHQFSFTLPYSFLNANAVNGFGDVFINYRYQLSTSDDWAACSPRLSFIIASGDEKKGFGEGANGIQVNVPLSKRLTDAFVVHCNAGATTLFNKKGTDGSGIEVKKTTMAYNVGGSVIWLTKKSFNVMLEALLLYGQDFTSNGELEFSSETIVSPGVRYAIDIGELQIVPGIAVPVNITKTQTRFGTFFYLSFEHPF